MKKMYFFIALSTLVFLLNSCGGVIGNIEKYRFENISIDSLKNAVQRVYLIQSEFKDFDTIKYKTGTGIGDGDYYCRLKENGQDYIFQYAYPQYPPPNDTIVEIALTSAANYGENLKLAKHISSLEKKQYSTLFESHFLKAIKNELKK